jgi:hypothetical protein
VALWSSFSVPSLGFLARCACWWRECGSAVLSSLFWLFCLAIALLFVGLGLWSCRLSGMLQCVVCLVGLWFSFVLPGDVAGFMLYTSRL